MSEGYQLIQWNHVFDRNIQNTMDDAGVIRPLINAPENRPDHWQTLVTGDAVVKAEENDKIVVLTDIVFAGASGAAVSQGYIREKDAAGAQLLYMCGNVNTFDVNTLSFRQGIEGAAYDGSNAGDLFFDKTGGTPIVTCTGYMRAV